MPGCETRRIVTGAVIARGASTRREVVRRRTPERTSALTSSISRPSGVRMPAISRPVCGFDDIAHRVDRYERSDGEPGGERDQRSRQPALHAAIVAGELTDGCTGAHADAPLLDFAVGRDSSRLIAAVGRGANLRGRAHFQIDQNGRRHNRHNRATDSEADPLLVQIADHAARRVEAERAAARQHHGMNLFDRVDRIEEVQGVSLRADLTRGPAPKKHAEFRRVSSQVASRAASAWAAKAGHYR